MQICRKNPEAVGSEKRGQGHNEVFMYLNPVLDTSQWQSQLPAQRDDDYHEKSLISSLQCARRYA